MWGCPDCLAGLRHKLAQAEAARVEAEKRADENWLAHELNSKTMELQAAEISALRAEIGAIANAPWGNFRDADEFRAWALNRCRAALGESIQRGKG